MNNKTFLVCYAILWFCIGGLITVNVFKILVEDNVIKDYQNAIFECQKSKLDLIK